MIRLGRAVPANDTFWKSSRSPAFTMSFPKVAPSVTYAPPLVACDVSVPLTVRLASGPWSASLWV